MWLRIASAAVAIPILLIVVWLGDPVFSLVVGMAAVWGGWEFYGMARFAGYAPLRLLGAFLILLSAINTYLQGTYSLQLITLAAMASLVWLLARQSVENALANWALTLGGIIYPGWLLSHYILLRQVENGMNWVLLTLFSTFAIDTAAFFVGRAIGRHRLAPLISPGKTWEGSVGGFVAGLIAVVALSQILALPIALAQAVALGALLGVLAQVGDLAESLFKRSTRVKDASTIIPGHGGLLDRSDSLMFSVVVVYYYAVWATT